MSFLTLLDIFRKFPVASRPLLAYHEVIMRGPSRLQVAERELIAAYVSGLNACRYCHGVHAATAARLGVPESLSKTLIEDPARAPIEARMTPLSSFVKKLTLTPSRISQADADLVFAAGWNEQVLHDAISVCALFNYMNRLVEGLGVKTDPGYFKTASERLW